MIDLKTAELETATPPLARRFAAPGATDETRPTLRFPRLAEAQAVEALYDGAYGDASASAALRRLRADEDLLFTIIAEHYGAVIGAASFVSAQIRSEAGEATSAAALALVAVIPRFRMRGVGVSLIRAGLSQARRRDLPAAVASGPPRFLDAAGFSRVDALGLKSAWPAEAVRLARLQTGMAAPVGDIYLPRALFGEGPDPAAATDAGTADDDASPEARLRGGRRFGDA